MVNVCLNAIKTPITRYQTCFNLIYRQRDIGAKVMLNQNESLSLMPQDAGLVTRLLEVSSLTHAFAEGHFDAWNSGTASELHEGIQRGTGRSIGILVH